MERRRSNAASRKKHAIILSGGGAKGAYEIGVMEAIFSGSVRCLEKKDVDPVVFAGTSVGSYNAAYLVSRRGMPAKDALLDLKAIWKRQIGSNYSRPNGVLRFRANPLEGMEIDRLLAAPLAPFANFIEDGLFFAIESIERLKQFFRSNERWTSRVIELVDVSTFIATERLRDLVYSTIALGEIRANSDRALAIAATNWELGEVQLFGNVKSGAWPNLTVLDDKIGHKAILASTAIPGVFPPVEIYHTKYVDGGLLLNTPLSPAIKGLRAIAPDKNDEWILHVIYLDPDLKDVPPGRGNNTMDTISRFAALSFASQVNRDIKQARHINKALETKHQDGSVEPPKGVEYRPLTIHRYHPRDTLGGVLGLLAFDSDYIGGLISRGFEDAVKHDCVQEGCIYPTYDKVEKLKKARPEARQASAVGTPPAGPHLIANRRLPEA